MSSGFLQLLPLGFTLGVLLGLVRIDQGGLEGFQALRLSYVHAVFVFPVLVVVYYLVWKYIVGFLNDFLGIG